MFYGVIIVLLMVLRPQGLIAQRATARRRRPEAG
jgi:ABC-type branched-subunit amino acid transport system permease subunit